MTVGEFWDNVNRTGGPDCCWPWLGWADADGHGRVLVGEASVPAHRVAYRLGHGPIPIDKGVVQTCKTRCCVNPAHLELGEARRASTSRLNYACRNGHVRTPANTKIRSNGQRMCLTCKREAKRVGSAARPGVG